MKRIGLIALASVAILPAFAHAQLGNVENIIEQIGNLVNLATPIVVGIALLVFFWGLVKFLASDGEDKEKGKNLMIGGIIALFVIVSIVGIIRWIGDAVDIDQGGTLPVPGVDDTAGGNKR